MHPITSNRATAAVYLALWLLLGALLALLAAGQASERWPAALAVLVPSSLLLAVVCLAAWYPCRVNPLTSGRIVRGILIHVASAALAAALWLGLTLSWARVLDTAGFTPGAAELVGEQQALLLGAATLLYLLTVAIYYLRLATEAARRAEGRAVELKLAAKQAELDAFKAQIDPHFLFNCLNSISSLCGSDPKAARRTAIRLGEFLRASLAHGSNDLIPLAEELELTAAYLEVEQARFGERLAYRESIDAEALDARVPALLLQPLIENALKHGIAHLLEGGTVEIRGRRIGSRLELVVANDCDPDRPESSGTGIGLANVRGRLRLLYGDEALVTVHSEPNAFRVSLVIPKQPDRQPEESPS